MRLNITYKHAMARRHLHYDMECYTHHTWKVAVQHPITRFPTCVADAITLPHFRRRGPGGKSHRSHPYARGYLTFPSLPHTPGSFLVRGSVHPTTNSSVPGSVTPASNYSLRSPMHFTPSCRCLGLGSLYSRVCVVDRTAWLLKAYVASMGQTVLGGFLHQRNRVDDSDATQLLAHLLPDSPHNHAALTLQPAGRSGRALLPFGTERWTKRGGLAVDNDYASLVAVCRSWDVHAHPAFYCDHQFHLPPPPI